MNREERITRKLKRQVKEMKKSGGDPHKIKKVRREIKKLRNE